MIHALLFYRSLLSRIHLRQLVKALEAQGITSIEPDAYVQLTQRKTALDKQIVELKKKTSKRKVKAFLLHEVCQ